MKSYIYPVLLLVCGTFAARCSKSTDPAPVDPDNQNYTSYWYYNYEALDIVTHETLGLTTANEFNPGTVAQRGD
ncbi:MAG: quinoprotein amine dehydrogenase, partial [Alistipes sp.]|nr:quinoprotein amine dehydrogenase [Alistipes sp.]